MKSVLTLTGFGLAVLAILSCRSSTPPPAPPAPMSMPEPRPIVEIVDKIEPDEPPDRVLSSAELLILKDDLNLIKIPEEGVEYVRMSRAGPQRFLKLKQQKAEEQVGWQVLGTGTTEHKFYSRAGPRPRPVKSIAKQE